MKKYLLAAALSLVFSLNASAVTLNTEKTEQLMLITGMMLQNSYLVYNDIYTYTKPGINLYGGKEGNPVAAGLFKSGGWDLGFAAALAAQAAGNGFAYLIEPTGKLNWIINASIAGLELFAISTWKFEKLPAIKFKVTALVMKF